jgi:hypothetical protein
MPISCRKEIEQDYLRFFPIPADKNETGINELAVDAAGSPWPAPVAVPQVSSFDQFTVSPRRSIEMNEQYARTTTQPRFVDAVARAADLAAEAPMTEERLPFTVRLVQTEDELWKAVRIRHAAYARHLPTLADKLRVPESADFDTDTVIVLAESRLDGEPLGSARIQTNLERPLCVEQSVELPLWMQGHSLAEITRLGVEEGRVGRLVKAALLKAIFTWCQQNGMDWMVAAGRSPIDRQYEQLLFEDVFPEGGFIPLQHAGNLPHRVMAFHMASGYARWAAANHPLFKFFFRTRHADINLSAGAGKRFANAMAAAHFSAKAGLAGTGARTGA